MQKATQEQIKNQNTSLVLRTIYQTRSISRADIARATGLTRPTVSLIVGELMELDLVTEIGYGPSVGGKPPLILEFHANSRNILCIDIANTEFRGALVNLRGDITHRSSLPAEEVTGDEAVQIVYRLIDQLLAASSVPLLGIGIGTPGLMDPTQGIVRQAVNLDWRDLPLGSLLSSRYNIPAYVANDSQIAALAELTFGMGVNSSNLVVIKIGRGVGAGIIIDRHLYYGDSFGAGEIGHVQVIPGGDLCRCGQRGCLETVISSRALRKQSEAVLGSAVTSDDLFAAFQAGRPEIVALIDDAGQHLGKAVAHLVSALDIHHILIAGSLARYGDRLTRTVQQQLSGVLPSIARETRIETSSLGSDIVTLGAAALVLSNELNLP
jgi:predicted NBD/HSP70 family sugar kinase